MIKGSTTSSFQWGKYNEDNLFLFPARYAFMDKAVSKNAELHLYGVWIDLNDISVDNAVFKQNDEIIDGVLDSTYTIQRALNIARDSCSPVTVKIPAGTYYISRTIHVYSNTHVVLDDKARIRRRTEIGAWTFYVGGDTSLGGGYNQGHDVTIEGGTLIGNPIGGYNTACLVRFSHCQDVTLKDCTIENYSAKHAVIFAGVKNGTAQNIIIEDQVIKPGGSLDGAKEKTLKDSESIHIDNITKEGEPIAIPVDNTICDNITVQDCVIDNVLSGVGSHVEEVNSAGQIKILNNEFHDVKYVCLNIYNRANVIVQGNKAYHLNEFLRDHNSLYEIYEEATVYEVSEDDKTGMRELYYNVLSSIQNYSFPHADNNIRKYEYLLVDINGDGIRELIVGALFIGEEDQKLYRDCMIFTCRKSLGSYYLKPISGSIVVEELYLPGDDSMGLYNRKYNDSTDTYTVYRMTISANILYQTKRAEVESSSDEIKEFDEINTAFEWMDISNTSALRVLPN